MAFQHGQRLRLDGLTAEPLTLRLSVNRRARRVSIRIDARVGEAVVTAPSERRLKDGVDFARAKAAWIAERLAVRPPSSPLAPGGAIPLQGRTVRLAATGGTGAARLVQTPEGPTILSGGEGEAYARRVVNLMKRLAREALTAHTEVHLQALGQKPVTLSIADTKSRWGSCSPHNRSIRYSWRVIMAPPPVLDYLAAHEVAHLVHADHSPAYWSVVERLIGDPRPHRKWLRDHGASLHAVGR